MLRYVFIGIESYLTIQKKLRAKIVAISVFIAVVALSILLSGLYKSCDILSRYAHVHIRSAFT